ncbi:hypothetical protein COT72_02855 [archaeon CG10_big_fil_rev_8_21_14_0_10_43_11]|nr:MAG: hypothetical protein COT72_02855 [archaeon CG10_big_fil_rev_8_21_14_0_10_43_11]
MSEQKKLNMIVDNSNNAFYATQVSINFSAQDFLLDFGQITPRFTVTPKGDEVVYVSKHETLILSPVLAKKVYALLGSQLAKYENDHGEIKVPKQKKMKKAKHVAKISPEDVLSSASAKYIG